MYSKGMTSNLTKLFRRNLEQLSAELEAYATETALWTLVGDIKNSPGTLTLHIVGNLNHFIGATLGHSDYVRDRDAEFSRQDVPREELLEMVEDTRLMLERVLPDLDKDTLEGLYPQEVLGYPMTTQYFLIHLFGHLSYHLGQINYHRRLMAV